MLNLRRNNNMRKGNNLLWLKIVAALAILALCIVPALTSLPTYADTGGDIGGTDIGGADTGNVNVSAGDTGGADTGNVNVSAGDTGGADTGNVNVSAGDTGGADTGNVDVSAGDTGGADTGNVNVSAGDTGGADTGNVNVSAGDTGGADTGNVDVSAGDTGGADTVDADTAAADTGDGEQAGDCFAATISPTEAAVGSATDFTLTVTNINSGPGDPNIGEVQVQVPNNFTVDSATVQCNTTGPLANWTATWNAVLSTITAIADNWGQTLAASGTQSAEIDFTATPSGVEGNTYTFFTTAFTATHGKGQAFTLGAADTLAAGATQPTVSVISGDDGQGGGGDQGGGAPAPAPALPIFGELVMPPTIALAAEQPVLTINLLGHGAAYPVTPEGALLVDVVHASPDGSLVLEIPAGTIVQNADGTPAYLNFDYDVVGELLAATPPSQDSKIVVAYQILPSGLKFSNGVATLVATYDPANVPAGATLTWAFYNGSTGLWETLDTAGYVAAGKPLANTVTTEVTISNFGYVAILAR
jgi:hypothetical protein